MYACTQTSKQPHSIHPCRRMWQQALWHEIGFRWEFWGKFATAFLTSSSIFLLEFISQVRNHAIPWVWQIRSSTFGNSECPFSWKCPSSSRPASSVAPEFMDLEFNPHHSRAQLMCLSSLLVNLEQLYDKKNYCSAIRNLQAYKTAQNPIFLCTLLPWFFLFN